MRNYDSSFLYYYKVRDISLENNFWDINSFHAFMNIGINYASQDIYDTALLYFDTARIVIDRAGLDDAIDQTALYYYNYALLNTYMGKLEEADELYAIASKQYEELGGKDIVSAAGIYNNLGINNYIRFKLDKAELQFKKSLDLFNKIGNKNPEIIAHIYNNLSLISQQKGNYESSINYCIKGLDVNPRNDLKISLLKSQIVKLIKKELKKLVFLLKFL